MKISYLSVLLKETSLEKPAVIQVISKNLGYSDNLFTHLA